MVVDSRLSAGAVDARNSPHARWRTLPARAVSLTPGFWTERQRLNRDRGLPHGLRMLEQAGNLDNLRIAAGRLQSTYRGPVFMDSDVYKWIEAVALEILHHGPVPESSAVDDTVALIAAAQQPDGYLNSYYTVAEPGRRWTDLAHGHEMYCAGHLFQAAVALRRATGDDRLLGVAQRLADHIDTVFGPGKRIATPGHPEIEMGLVELYRETGIARYLDLAQFLVDQRGRGLLGPGRYNSSAYYQDRVPVREAATVEGHAVRAMYLATGVADIYLETGEQALLTALDRQWHDMVDGKMYITAGLGSRHLGEAFGQPYELPNATAYCETCAAIGNINWNWRMLLATGDARFADLIERALFNGFLSGLSLDGDRYFYVNPLANEGIPEVLGRTAPQRMEWHQVACCPPNVMRTLASLDDFLATCDQSGLQIHQYAPARIAASLPDGARIGLRIDTNYPWEGRIVVQIEEAPEARVSLRLRVPAWSPGARLAVNGEVVEQAGAAGYAVVERRWQMGDRLTLDLDMAPRMIAGHPWIESTRDHLAIERGPLVYCVEQADQGSNRVPDLEVPAGVSLEDAWQPDVLGGIVEVRCRGRVRDPNAWSSAPYRPVDQVAEAAPEPVDITFIPYHAWANRGPGAMRVWIPRARSRGDIA